MHIQTPNSSPDDQDWYFTEYVFPGEGISTDCANDVECGIEDTFVHGCEGCNIGVNPMHFMFEAFPRTEACDSTWLDDITITQLVEQRPPPPTQGAPCALDCRTNGRVRLMTELGHSRLAVRAGWRAGKDSIPLLGPSTHMTT